MKQVDKISVAELSQMAQKMYGKFVKGVVDLEKNLLVLDAEMHVDEEQYLLEAGSQQRHLWGINLHPDQHGTDDFIEFDSMINIRPSQHNLTRGIEDEAIRKRIRELIHDIVKP